MKNYLRPALFVLWTSFCLSLPALAAYLAGGSNNQILYNCNGSQCGATVSTGLSLSGGNLTATGAASSLTVGTTTVGSGTNGYVLYDNSGVLGNLVASTTVNGQTCALGLTCTVTATATTITEGTTTVSGGSSGDVLYNNSGVLGGLTNVAKLSVADQTVTGGANITSQSQSAGNITVDCGSRPAQYIPNTGGFTITAPANDGYCYLDVENGSGAGTITLSGFSPNTMGGATLDTTNGHNFRLIISRVHGHANISAVALQ